MTKKAARETIEAYKDLTGYFDNSITQNEMYEMLRYRMRFGEAETRVIIAALVLAGANFKKEQKGDWSKMRVVKIDNNVMKIFSNDKEVFYGYVGTIENLIKENILLSSDYSKELYCFVPALGIIKHQFYARTLDDILRSL